MPTFLVWWAWINPQQLEAKDKIRFKKARDSNPETNDLCGILHVSSFNGTFNSFEWSFS